MAGVARTGTSSNYSPLSLLSDANNWLGQAQDYVWNNFTQPVGSWLDDKTTGALNYIDPYWESRDYSGTAKQILDQTPLGGPVANFLVDAGPSFAAGFTPAIGESMSVNDYNDQSNAAKQAFSSGHWGEGIGHSGLAVLGAAGMLPILAGMTHPVIKGMEDLGERGGPWFSALKDRVEKLPFKKPVAPENWRGELAPGKEGIKKAELEATGLDRVLGGDQPLAKADLLSYLESNGLNLGEKILVEPGHDYIQDQIRSLNHPAFEQWVTRTNEPIKWDPQTAFDDYDRWVSMNSEGGAITNAHSGMDITYGPEDMTPLSEETKEAYRNLHKSLQEGNIRPDAYFHTVVDLLPGGTNRTEHLITLDRRPPPGIKEAQDELKSLQASRDVADKEANEAWARVGRHPDGYDALLALRDEHMPDVSDPELKELTLDAYHKIQATNEIGAKIAKVQSRIEDLKSGVSFDKDLEAAWAEHDTMMNKTEELRRAHLDTMNEFHAARSDDRHDNYNKGPHASGYTDPDLFIQQVERGARTASPETIAAARKAARAMEEYRPARAALNDVQRRIQMLEKNKNEAKGVWGRGHWPSIPNVAAHMLTSDREVDPSLFGLDPSHFTDEAGNPRPLKVLHIEEGQSDWGQKARPPEPGGGGGYGVMEGERGRQWRETRDKREEVKNRLDEAVKRFKDEKDRAVQLIALVNQQQASSRLMRDVHYPNMHDQMDTAIKLSGLPEEHFAALRKAADDANRVSAEWQALPSDSTNRPVPPSPYLDTKAWSGLIFKRALKKAVDEGYDAVSWPHGKVLEARYPDEAREGDQAGKGFPHLYDTIFPSVAKDLRKFGASEPARGHIQVDPSKAERSGELQDRDYENAREQASEAAHSAMMERTRDAIQPVLRLPGRETTELIERAVAGDEEAINKVAKALEENGDTYSTEDLREIFDSPNVNDAWYSYVGEVEENYIADFLDNGPWNGGGQWDENGHAPVHFIMAPKKGSKSHSMIWRHGLPLMSVPLAIGASQMGGLTGQDQKE